MSLQTVSLLYLKTKIKPFSLLVVTFLTLSDGKKTIFSRAFLSLSRQAAEWYMSAANSGIDRGRSRCHYHDDLGGLGTQLLPLPASADI